MIGESAIVRRSEFRVSLLDIKHLLKCHVTIHSFSPRSSKHNAGGTHPSLDIPP